MSSAAGRLGFTVAGTIVGAAFGFPGLGAFAGTLAGSIFFPQELPDRFGPRLSDLSVTTASYGKSITILSGTHRLGGTVVWSPGLVEHTQSEEVGGKGGPTQKTTSFVYTASFRVILCEGIADAILQIWSDGVLIFDITGTGPIEDVNGSGVGTPAIRLYLGTESQEPDSAEQADKGIADTPAYRGVVSIVFQDLEVTRSGNRIPQITAVVAMSSTETLPSTTLTGVSPNGLNWEWQVKGQTFLIDSMTRIDNAGQTVVATASLHDRPTFPCTDSFGNFYRAFENFALTTGHVEKYDGVTLSLLQSGNQLKNPFDLSDTFDTSADWFNGRIFGGGVLPDGTVAGELLFLSRLSGSLVLIVAVGALDNDTGGAVNTYSTTSQVSGSMTVDSDRNLWVFHNSGSDTKLYRISPGTGSIGATFIVFGDTTTDITYESSTNSLILGNFASHLIRWGIDSEAIEARLDSITYTDKKNGAHFRNGPSNEGRMYLQTGNTLGVFTEFDIINMVEGRNWSPFLDFGVGGSSTVHRGIYDPLRHAKIVRDDSGGQVHWVYLDRENSNLITVRSVVEDLSSRVELIAGIDITATALTDTLNSHVVDRRMPASDAIDPLLPTFQFTLRESDFIVEFIKRGGSSSATIDIDDMAARADSIREEIVALEETVIQEIELPQVLDISYADPTADYQANVQTAKLPAATTNTKRRQSISFPGALSNDLAAQSVQKALTARWANRRPVSFSVSQKHLLTDPADVITAEEVNELILENGDSLLTEDGSGVLLLEDSFSISIELTNVDLGADNSIRMLGVRDQTSAFTSTVTGSSTGTPAQSIILTAASEFFIADIPLLRDADEGFGLYGAMGSNNDLAGWPGGVIRRSTDAISFSSLFATFPPSRNVSHGWATTALPNAISEVFDRINAVIINLLRGTLSSSTEDAVLDGANALLIGGEIIQFVTAVLNSDGTYTLSILLRGRRGSEFATSTHLIGDRVIVLSESTVLRVPLDISDLNVTSFYKAQTAGGSLSVSALKSLKNTGASQKPLAPNHVTGTIASNDWTFKLKSRTRIDQSWKDSIGAPLGEASEDYELDILSGPAGTVKRKITTTASANGSVVTPATQTIFYDDADQIADFTTVQTTLSVIPFQISESVGRGFGTEVTLVGG